MNKRKLVFYLISIFVLFTGSSLSLLAQQQAKGIVAGRVTDSNKEAIEGIAVAIKGSIIGVYTNEKGEYLLTNVPAGTHQLVVSGVGITTTKLSVRVLAGQTVQIPTIEVENRLDLGEIAVQRTCHTR